MVIDVSLVLNLHREGKYAARSLLSLKEAATFAKIHGLAVEIVVVLDCPDEATKTVVSNFDLSMFETSQVVEVRHQSLGLARNEGMERSLGKYVRLCDGDDLISYNLVSEMFFLAEKLGPYAILIAEWLFAFGDNYFRNQYVNSDVVTPLSLIDDHPFVSQIFVPRTIYNHLQFESFNVSSAYAYEDWHFATKALNFGYKYYVAKDTILFYRQRGGSLLNQASHASVKQIAMSPLFTPERYLRICGDAYQATGTRKSAIRDDRIFIEGEVGPHLVHAASQIEPALSLNLLRSSTYHNLTNRNIELGRKYYKICEEIGDQVYTDIFIVPFFGRGGAEKYIANIIHELIEIVPNPSIMVILGESHADNHWLKMLPPEVKVVDLGACLDSIGAAGVDTITLKLVQSVGQSARLHVRDSAYGQRFFAKFGRALSSNRRIFYCFSQAVQLEGNMPFVEPSRFQFVSENFEHIDIVLSDTRAIEDFDRPRMAFNVNNWRVLPPCLDVVVDRETLVAKSSQLSKHILWASRFSNEKRPTLIPAVAKRLKETRPDVWIDVFGEPTKAFDPRRFARDKNIQFHGAYDSFGEIASGGFLCLMYTSSQDGLPNVLLESAAAGVPIVAPRVGAISEFVEDGVTGLLLQDSPDERVMANAYADAIVRLLEDPDLRLRLAVAAFDRVVAFYSRPMYRKNLMKVLEVGVG